MKIPAVLKSLGKVLRINYVTTAQGHEDVGSYVHFYSTINLLKQDEINEEEQAETLMHELFEHINATYDLKLEHTILCTFSANLFAIIRENGLDFRRPK